MTPEQAKTVLPFIQAYIAGKKIQFYNKARGQWVTVSDPSFTPYVTWRIMPEKKTFWLNIYSDASDLCTHDTKTEADKAALPSRIACVQVTYEDGEGLK